MITAAKAAAVAVAALAGSGGAGWQITDARHDGQWTASSRYSAVRVRRGDTLTRIAREAHTSVPELRRLNPQIHDPDMIRVGDQVRVP
jgi:LysM repeat protein